MLLRFRQWLSARRLWRRTHDSAWSAVIVPGPDGISPYLHSLRGDLLDAVPELQLRLSGDTEKYLHGTIPETKAIVYLYSDGAQIHEGPNQLFWAEYHDYLTPQELTEALVSRVRKVHPNPSFKVRPLRGAPQFNS
jgi:hypothetical protein